MELSLHFGPKQSNSAAAPPVHMQIVRSGTQNLSCDEVLQRGHFLVAVSLHFTFYKLVSCCSCKGALLARPSISQCS